MNDKSLRITVLAVAAMALLAIPDLTGAQTEQDLVKQLCGKAEAPARNPGQLAEAYQKAVDYLLPLMSADDVASRYPYQINFQDMGSYASRPGAEVERDALAKVMVKTVDQATMPAVVRYWFVQQLERIGKGESVPALAKWMSADDKILRDYARRALEKNPDPGATEALLKELSATKEPTWRIGLINALGTRRAEKALGPIVQALADPDPKVAAAAVTAISQIGGTEASKALLTAVDKPSGEVSVKAAQGLVDMAHDMVLRKDTPRAAMIYLALYDRAGQPARAIPSSIRAAAVAGLIVCNSERGTSDLGVWMQDEDRRIREAVVRAVRQAPSKATTQALGQMLPKLRPDAQVQVLSLIGDLQDASCIGPVKEAMNSQDEAVCLAAVDAMTRIGTEAGATALLQVAVGGKGPSQRAAQDGLAAMPGPQVEKVIAAQAGSGDVRTRVVAIGLVGQRRMQGAAKTLLGYAAETNEEISGSAFQALVNVAESVDLAALTDLVARTQGSAARDKGSLALRAALSKAKDTDAAAQIVIDRMAKADAGTKSLLLSCLSRAGGETALKAVTEATQSTDAALREAAIRTLSEWPDIEAGQRLLAIASNPDTPLNQYVVAMGAACRLITRSTGAPLDARASLCLSAFDHARRDEEKRLAIAAMGSVPSTKVADRLLELTQDSTFKTEAALAAVALAGNMSGADRQAGRDLAQKIRGLNISDEVNSRADAAMRGGMRGRRRGGP